MSDSQKVNIPRRCVAPFSGVEIEKIRDWQDSQFTHPLTCPSANCRAELTPKRDGMYCPKEEKIVQNWVPGVVLAGLVGTLSTREDYNSDLSENERDHGEATSEPDDESEPDAHESTPHNEVKDKSA